MGKRFEEQESRRTRLILGAELVDFPKKRGHCIGQGRGRGVCGGWFLGLRVGNPPHFPGMRHPLRVQRKPTGADLHQPLRLRLSRPTDEAVALN